MALRYPEKLPEGYKTVFAANAEDWPGAVLFMEDPIKACVQDDALARKTAIMLGEPVVLLEAPAELRRHGVRHFGGYTKATLLEALRA